MPNKTNKINKTKQETNDSTIFIHSYNNNDFIFDVCLQKEM